MTSEIKQSYEVLGMTINADAKAIRLDETDVKAYQYRGFIFSKYGFAV